jgi:hypothetical protein
MKPFCGGKKTGFRKLAVAVSLAGRGGSLRKLVGDVCGGVWITD